MATPPPRDEIVERQRSDQDGSDDEERDRVVGSGVDESLDDDPHAEAKDDYSANEPKGSLGH